MAIAATFAGEAFYAWWDPSDLSTLFQDTAATIPVTAVGQSIGRVNDKSGNGFHLLQATNGKRPTLQQDGSGRYVIRIGAGHSLRTANGVLNRPVLSMSIMSKVTWSAFCTLAGFPAYPTQHSPNYFQFFVGTGSDYGRGACRLDNVAVSSPASNFYSPGTTQVYEFHSTDGKAYTDRVERMSITPATVVYPRAVPFMIGANGADQEVLQQDVYGCVLLGRNMTADERILVYNDLVTPPTGSSPATGTASGSLGVTGSAQGAAKASGAASGALAFAGVSQAAARAVGAAAGSILLSGVSSGMALARSLAAGAVAFTGAATGKAASASVASGAVSIGGSAAGKAQASAVGAGPVPISGAGKGAVLTRGTASGSIALSGSASSSPSPLTDATAAGSLDVAGLAAGRALSRAAGSGALAFTGVAAGLALVRAAGAGAVAFAGAFVGRVLAVGASAGEVEITGTALAQTTVEAQAAGQIILSGAALARAVDPEEIIAAMAEIAGTWGPAVARGAWITYSVPGRWGAVEIQGEWN